VTNEEFQNAAHRITQAITDTIENHVPLVKPSPHSKRWWSRQLSDRRKQVARLQRTAYQMRALPLHECHQELKKLRNLFAEEIASAKKTHWTNWLENLEGNDLWTAN